MHDKLIDELSSFAEENWWHQGRRKILCDMMKKMVGNKQDKQILDVGCGPGGTSSHFLEFGKVIGMDSSISAIKHALKKRLDDVFISTIDSQPIQGEIFDIITALDVIEHIKDDSKALIELKRIMKKDGVIIITVPAFQFLWSERDIALSHFRRYTIDSLTRTLSESGFRVMRISYFFSFVFPLFFIQRALNGFKVSKKKPKNIVIRFPNTINNLLNKLMSIENLLLKKFNLPFGTSIICIAKRT